MVRAIGILGFFISAIMLPLGVMAQQEDPAPVEAAMAVDAGVADDLSGVVVDFSVGEVSISGTRNTGPGANVPLGRTVRTDSNGYLSLHVGGSAYINVMPLSTVQFADAEGRFILNLTRGRVLVDSAEAPLEIRTATAIVQPQQAVVSVHTMGSTAKVVNVVGESAVVNRAFPEATETMAPGTMVYVNREATTESLSQPLMPYDADEVNGAIATFMMLREMDPIQGGGGNVMLDRVVRILDGRKADIEDAIAELNRLREDPLSDEEFQRRVGDVLTRLAEISGEIDAAFVGADGSAVALRDTIPDGGFPTLQTQLSGLVNQAQAGAAGVPLAPVDEAALADPEIPDFAAADENAVVAGNDVSAIVTNAQTELAELQTAANALVAARGNPTLNRGNLDAAIAGLGAAAGQLNAGGQGGPAASAEAVASVQTAINDVRAASQNLQAPDLDAALAQAEAAIPQLSTGGQGAVNPAAVQSVQQAIQAVQQAAGQVTIVQQPEPAALGQVGNVVARLTERLNQVSATAAAEIPVPTNDRIVELQRQLADTLRTNAQQARDQAQALAVAQGEAQRATAQADILRQAMQQIADAVAAASEGDTAALGALYDQSEALRTQLVEGQTAANELGLLAGQRLLDDYQRLFEMIQENSGQLEGYEALLDQIEADASSLAEMAEENVELSNRLAELETERDALLNRIEQGLGQVQERLIPWSQLEALLNLDQGDTLDTMYVVLTDEIRFDTGSATLTEAGAQSIRAIVDQIERYLENDEYQILVEGRADERQITGQLADTFPTNWELSAARSMAVTRELLGLLEDPSAGSRIISMARGDAAPLDPNGDEVEVFAFNRSVRIIVVTRLESLDQAE